ncbi:MAG: hypothetical protein JWM80_6348 [Cyanobacteria bacterium RYN_339]|nr:hypothetical protein [Cyanobacteria bacterium RYN_339]
MDWVGDPGGAAVAAVIGLALLALIAIAWGVALHNRRAAQGEFQASEPDTMEEIHMHPLDVHKGNDPPSSL